MTSDTRDTLLNAIAKARRWVDDITSGRVKSFAYIAKNEKKVERHIRLLALLAFVAPSIVHAHHRGNSARQSHGHRTCKIVRAFMAPTTSPTQGKSEALT